MMETTVTMPLERYKQLESFEKAFNELKKDTKNFLYLGEGYYGEYLVSVENEANLKLLKDLKNAIELRDAVIKEVREYEGRTGKKVFKP